MKLKRQRDWIYWSAIPKPKGFCEDSLDARVARETGMYAVVPDIVRVMVYRPLHALGDLPNQKDIMLTHETNVA